MRMQLRADDAHARSRRLSLRLREQLCSPARTPRCRSLALGEASGSEPSRRGRRPPVVRAAQNDRPGADEIVHIRHDFRSDETEALDPVSGAVASLVPCESGATGLHGARTARGCRSPDPRRRWLPVLARRSSLRAASRLGYRWQSRLTPRCTWRRPTDAGQRDPVSDVAGPETPSRPPRCSPAGAITQR